MRVFCPFVRLKLHVNIYNLTHVLARDLTRKLFQVHLGPRHFRTYIGTSVFLFILLSQFKHTNQQWNIVSVPVTDKKEVLIKYIVVIIVVVVNTWNNLGLNMKSQTPDYSYTPRIINQSPDMDVQFFVLRTLVLLPTMSCGLRQVSKTTSVTCQCMPSVKN